MCVYHLLKEKALRPAAADVAHTANAETAWRWLWPQLACEDLSLVSMLMQLPFTEVRCPCIPLSFCHVPALLLCSSTLPMVLLSLCTAVLWLYCLPF